MTRRSDIVGAILSGGQARRMGGGDKCLMPVAGRPLLSTIIDRLRPQVSDIMLNANGDPDRFSAFGLPVVPDVIPGFGGPLIGVLTALRWTAEHRPTAGHVATVAGDTPFFPVAMVSRLHGAANGVDDAIALARSDGQVQPIFGLWPVDLVDDLEAWLSSGTSRKVLGWVGEHTRIDVDFAVQGQIEPFFNINTPEDLTRAEDLISTVGTPLS